MTVYEWTETENFIVARVRPRELFHVDTVESLPSWEEWNDPDIDGSPEGILRARYVTTGEWGTYAYFFDHRVGRDYAERSLARWPEKFAAADTRDIGRLRTLA